MTAMKISSCSLIMAFLFLVLSNTCLIFPAAGPTSLPRPERSKEPLFARWLVNQTTYGVLSTIDRYTGTPFGNIASHSDKGKGTPFYYLAIDRDPTVSNIMKDGRGSYTLSEKQLGSCGSLDPQSPKCSKLTLSGKFKRLGNTTEEGLNAKASLFHVHPVLGGWPVTHQFAFYKLEIQSVFLVNDFKKAILIPLSEYFNAKL